MDTTRNELTVEQKLDLIRSRARRMGLRSHDLEDVIQEVMLYLLEFTPDPEKANGASETTILTGVIDLRLKQWLRTRQRYQDMVDRCGELLPREDDQYAANEFPRFDTSHDVQNIITDLPEFERNVCRLLSEGESVLSIARALECDRRPVQRAIDAIRERLTEAGLGAEESC